MLDEWVSKVDKHGHVLGMMSRSDAHVKGDIYQAAHAFIVNDEGKILIQKRSELKTTWPNCFDLSIAEALKVEETYEQGLNRGLVEELGMPAQEMKLVREQYYQEYKTQEFFVNVVVKLYLISYTGDVSFPDHEVVSAKWMTRSEVDELIQKSPEKCTAWLITDWEFFKKTLKS